MIKVLSSSFGLSVQDLGRKGYRSIGVPTSGAMDLYSARLANLLLNNEENAAILEVTFGGCKLRFENDCMLSITGADFSPSINHQNVPLNSRLLVKKNSVLSFGKRGYGVRTYIAVQGGFQIQDVLGSRSMYKGITSTASVEKGIILPTIPQTLWQHKTHAVVKTDYAHFNTSEIRCYKGPEFELLSEAQQQQLLTSIFTISSNNSRMGYQLENAVPNEFPSMLTSAVLPGTVQLTPSGKLIVLMRDCQATGGYPRVLQLTETAINRLAQKTTGKTIRFIIE